MQPCYNLALPLPILAGSRMAFAALHCCLHAPAHPTLWLLPCLYLLPLAHACCPGNQIQQLPESIFSLPRLHTLNVSRNQVGRLGGQQHSTPSMQATVFNSLRFATASKQDLAEMREVLCGRVTIPRLCAWPSHSVISSACFCVRGPLCWVAPLYTLCVCTCMWVWPLAGGNIGSRIEHQEKKDNTMVYIWCIHTSPCCLIWP